MTRQRLQTKAMTVATIATPSPSLLEHLLGLRVWGVFAQKWTGATKFFCFGSNKLEAEWSQGGGEPFLREPIHETYSSEKSHFLE
jgi:hypothetical protein